MVHVYGRPLFDLNGENHWTGWWLAATPPADCPSFCVRLARCDLHGVWQDYKIIFSTREAFTRQSNLMSVYCFFNVCAAVSEGVAMFTMDILLSGWCSDSRYLCTCVAAGGLSWFTSSLLWQYFCMKTVLNAVFIGFFFTLMGNIFSNFTKRRKKTQLASSLMVFCHVGRFISSFIFILPEENLCFVQDLICITDIVSKS